MTEPEFLASKDPAKMLQLFVPRLAMSEAGSGDVPPRFKTSDRKLRLFAAAAARLRGVKDTSSYEAHPVPAVVYQSATDYAAEELEMLIRHKGLASGPPAAALLREIVGNPFRPVTLPRVLPAPIAKLADTVRHYAPTWAAGAAEEFGSCPWLTPTVLSLACAAYEERRRKCGTCKGGHKVPHVRGGGWLDCPDCNGTGTTTDGTLDPFRLALVADALEEAGCDDWWLLSHLRGEEMCPLCLAGDGRKACPACHEGNRPLPGPHVWGCFAIDCVLGKE